jgi:hypothetical protein
MLHAFFSCQTRWIGPSVSTFFIVLLNPKFRELDSWVGMVTNYGLDGPGLNPGRAKDIVLSKIVQTISVAHLNLLFSGHWDSFPGVKRPGPEVHYWPPSCAEFRNEWSCTYTSPVWIHGVDRDNFTFFITEFRVLMFLFHGKDLSIHILKAAFVSSSQDII